MSTRQSVAARGTRTLQTQPTGTLLSRLFLIVTLPIIWHERGCHRRDLLTIEERLLRDVGLTRKDIELEARKPFWQA
jgi:uncharacterized protein YjiS (DUF1127 family)